MARRSIHYSIQIVGVRVRLGLAKTAGGCLHNSLEYAVFYNLRAPITEIVRVPANGQQVGDLGCVRLQPERRKEWLK